MKIRLYIAFHILKLWVKRYKSMSNHRPTPLPLLWLSLDRKDLLVFQFLTVNNDQSSNYLWQSCEVLLIEVCEDMSTVRMCVVIPL